MGIRMKRADLPDSPPNTNVRNANLEPFANLNLVRKNDVSECVASALGSLQQRGLSDSLTLARAGSDSVMRVPDANNQ